MSDLTELLRRHNLMINGDNVTQQAADLIDAIDAIASAPVVDSHMVRQIERLIHPEVEA